MGYSISHKGYICYDSCANKFRISCNVVFFENQYFFPAHGASLPEINFFPHFDALSPPTLPLLETDPSSETAPTTSPEIELTSETDPISSFMPHEPGPR
jgi:hypothetical protein